MKKYIRLLSLVLALVTLAACSPKTNTPAPGTDDFAPPAKPASAFDGAVSASVSVADASLLYDLLGYWEYAEQYHPDALGWSTSLLIDADAGRLLYSVSDTLINGEQVRAYTLDREGKYEYTLTESLKPQKDILPASESVRFDRPTDLYSRYTGEQAIASLLAVLGDTSAPRQLSEQLLSGALGYSGSAKDTTDHTGKVRNISATFSCEEIASMLEGIGEDGDSALVWRAFFDNTPDTPIADAVRQSGDFSLSMRISADRETGRVQLADITARGAKTLLSLVYDGSTGDIEISTKNASRGIEADYSKKHEDKKITTTLRTERREGEKVTEGELRLICSDGALYFSSEKSENGKAQKSALKYDSNTSTCTLTGGDVTLTLTLENGKLTGKAKNTKTAELTELTFESEATDTKRTHTLVSVGGTDVRAAGVVFCHGKVQ